MRTRLRSVFSFPNPVNEVAARVVAGGVVVHVRASPWPAPAVAARPPRLRVLGPGADRADAEPPGPAGHPRRSPPGCARAPAGAGPAQALRPGDRRWCSRARPSCCGSGSAPRRGVGRARPARRGRPARVGVRRCAWGARSSPCSCASGLVPDTVCAGLRRHHRAHPRAATRAGRSDAAGAVSSASELGTLRRGAARARAISADSSRAQST